MEARPRRAVRVEEVEGGAHLTATGEARFGEEVTVTVRHKLVGGAAGE